MHKNTTTQLLNQIKKGKNIQVLEDCGTEIDDPTVGEYLRELLEKKNCKVSELAAGILLDRTFVYQFLDGSRVPNRGHLLRIAIVLGLNLDETQRMLKLARKGELYPRIRFDAAIIFAIQRRLSLAEVDEMLEKLGGGRPFCKNFFENFKIFEIKMRYPALS